MSVMTAEAASPTETTETPAVVRRRNAATRLAAIGGTAILLAVAGLGVGALGDRGSRTTFHRTVVTQAVAQGSAEIVVEMSYAPGEGSGWHLHPVAHTVEVLSGTLAVFDGSCRSRIYGPGDTYVGGAHVHLARNGGDVPVTMIVRTTEPTVAADSVTHVNSPAGCSVA